MPPFQSGVDKTYPQTSWVFGGCTSDFRLKGGRYRGGVRTGLVTRGVTCWPKVPTLFPGVGAIANPEDAFDRPARVVKAPSTGLGMVPKRACILGYVYRSFAQ